MHALKGFLHFIDQLDRDCREVIDEIERVLDFVRDARSQLTERGELLRLDQAVLCGSQIIQRLRELCRALAQFIE